MVTVCVPATTANLGPGFDTLGLALNLYNYIEMSMQDEGLQIEIEGEGVGLISTGETNIVYRAALKVWEKCGFNVPGIRLKLHNSIPLARGLGSSAAAITGGIVAANALAGYPLSKDEMLDLATQVEGHPDNVAPALLGGLVISIYEKGKVHSHRIAMPTHLRIGAVIPRFTLTTEKGRQMLPQRVSLQDAIFNIGRTAFLMAAFIQGKFELLGHGMEDKLHQPYRSQLVPGMEVALAEGKKAGAFGVALSGSGPTLIALGGDNITGICQAMLSAFTQRGLDAYTMELLPENNGARVINGGCSLA